MATQRGSKTVGMRPSKRHAALLLLLMLPPGLPPLANQHDTLHVVVVRMSNPSAPATLAGTRSFRDTLVTRLPFPVVIRDESLDAVETMGLDEQNDTRQAERLRAKYANTRIDLVVAVSSVALEFVLRHRAMFAPDAPVAYYNVSDRRIDAALLPQDVGGVTLHWDIAGTLALATRLQPQARTVVYVSGVAPYDKVFEPIFDEAMQRYGSQYRVSKLMGLSLTDLREQLAKLPHDSIILYSSMMRDADGTQYQPVDLVPWLSERASAPIYTFVSTYIGAGALGGSVVDFEEHGRIAGRYSAEVLKRLRGSETHKRRSVAAPSLCQIDDRQRMRWKIPRSRVPRTCERLNVTNATWRSGTAALVIGGCLALVIGAMTIALLSQEQKRVRAEREAQQRRAEAMHAARLAVIGKFSASIIHEVTQPLSAILSNADAAEMLLERKDPPMDQVREILADIRQDNERAYRIVSQLRLMLRKGQLQLASVDLNELIAAVVALISSEASRLQTRVEFRPEPALPPVAGDAVHLQQVLLNLLVNALDAVESVPATRRLIQVSVTYANAHALCVRVRDYGKGIPPDDLPKLFESFFTTKRNGMGLGLSIAKTIVEAHHGTLTAANCERGAEFSTTLPILRPACREDEESNAA